MLQPAATPHVFGAGHPAAAAIVPTPAAHASMVKEQTTVYIVQASDLDTARAAVHSAGGVVTRELAIINAVGAELTPRAVSALKARDDVRTLANTRMTTSSTKSSGASKTLSTMTSIASSTALADLINSYFPNNVSYPALIDADNARADQVTGDGVTVAVLDTGFSPVNGLQYDSMLRPRVVAGFDAINNVATSNPNDGNGHGTHLTGIIMNSDYAIDGTQTGVAPNAKLVDVKAFGDDGSGTYLDVLTGMNWILQNKVKYSIRVLNLSFSAAPSSHYWDDPVDQAVMKLWQAGVVVVASAGNDGPKAMTIGVPGNTPYIITVGAMTDSYTMDASDDKLASFSSVGPTYEGFIKPEVVAPGGHIVSLMQQDSSIAKAHPEFQVNGSYFRMSGTSQATAVVSGVVALMLQQKPWLTPDDVKCELMSTAKQAITSKKTLAYSVFQQGAGEINAQRAVASTEQACANRGLDIAADIAGRAHFGGLAQQDSSGNFYVSGVNSSLWSQGDTYSANGYTWSRTTLDNATLWSTGFLWSNGYLWSRSLPFNDAKTSSSLASSGSLWSRSAGVNHWVAQE